MFINKIAVVVLVVLSIVACKSTQNASGAADDAAATLIISYHQTPGDSKTAPEYSIELFSNRQMHLTATKGLDKQGKYMRSLTKEEYNQMVHAFASSSFFSLNDEYTDSITDLPTRYISFIYQGKSKKIKDYYGAPEELQSLELMVRSYLDRVGWSKMSW